MHELTNLLEQLIAFPSITPEDAGCQEFMMDYLKALGFSCQIINNPPVSNFFAHIGTEGPLLVFAGHTDVVPLGDLAAWNSDAFKLKSQDGLLYGRGVADMKGSLACMLLMAKHWVESQPTPQGRLGFLITSGEEGDLYLQGTPYVMQQLKEQQIHIDYCIVGEPSSSKQVGDVIKIGRRGSLSAKIKLQGKQGHVAYPHLAKNPIHDFGPVLAQLSTMEWDQGNAFFPPTSMQITYIHAGGHASNIIPGELSLHLNFRFSTEQTQTGLKTKLIELFHQHSLEPLIEWQLSGQPFLTQKGRLLDAAQKAILEQSGIKTELSTSGGTSDGRFIAPYGVEVVELGPVNASIHQVNEWVSAKDLEILERIYFNIAQQVLG